MVSGALLQRRGECRLEVDEGSSRSACDEERKGRYERCCSLCVHFPSGVAPNLLAFDENRLSTFEVFELHGRYEKGENRRGEFRSSGGVSITRFYTCLRVTVDRAMPVCIRGKRGYPPLYMLHVPRVESDLIADFYSARRELSSGA